MAARTLTMPPFGWSFLSMPVIITWRRIKFCIKVVTNKKAATFVTARSVYGKAISIPSDTWICSIVVKEIGTWCISSTQHLQIKFRIDIFGKPWLFDYISHRILPFSGMIYQKILNDTKHNIAVIFGVVEAAGSNPVTQTKWPLLERGAVFCFIGDIWLTEWLCECGAALLIYCKRL